MIEKLQQEGITKEERIGYLKSKVNLMQGTLYLTPNRLVLDAHKTGVGGFRLIGALLKRQVEKKGIGFDLEFNQIKEFNQGSHGRQQNVLEITNNNNELFRIIVKDYSEWEHELLKKR